MPRPRKPVLSKSVLRGLRATYRVVQYSLELPTETDFEARPDKELEEITLALKWISGITAWAEATNRIERETP